MISELSAAYQTAKTLANLAKEANKIEITNTVLELQRQLLEANQVAAELEAENRSLREQLRDRIDIAKLRAELVPQNGVYWRNIGRSEANGPFCSRCFDDEEKLVRVRWLSATWVECPKCKTRTDLEARNPAGGGHADTEYDPSEDQ